MKHLVTLGLSAALLAGSFAAADAREGRRHWRGDRGRTTIIQQPAVGIGVGLAGLLLLQQMSQPQQQPVYEQEPLPREPKLRRDSPIPLK
jgi:hypothetical protein